jgi:hypothetical protein
MTIEAATQQSPSSMISIQKLLPLVTCGVAAFGAFLNFVGVCIMQSNLDKVVKGSHSLDINWFHTFFYIAVIVAFSLMSYFAKMEHRLTVLSFLIIGFVFLTDDMNGYIAGARIEDASTGNSNYTYGGAATAFSGCFFMIFPFIAMIVDIGENYSAKPHA